MHSSIIFLLQDLTIIYRIQKLYFNYDYANKTESYFQKSILIKEFFLEYIKEKNLSVLIIGSINNYLCESHSVYETKVKEYQIKFFDCTPADMSNLRHSLLLTIKLTFLDSIMSKNTDTVRLISVKDGMCILYDPESKKNVFILYKDFLFEKYDSNTIDLSDKGLKDAFLKIEQSNEYYNSFIIPNIKENRSYTTDTNPIEDDTNPIKKNTLLLIKQALVFYKSYFLSGISFLIFIYLIKDYFFMQKAY